MPLTNFLEDWLVFFPRVNRQHLQDYETYLRICPCTAYDLRPVRGRLDSLLQLLASSAIISPFSFMFTWRKYRSYDKRQNCAILLGCGSFVRGRKRKKGDSIPFILSRRDYMTRLHDE